MHADAPVPAVLGRILAAGPPLRTGGWAIGYRALGVVLELVEVRRCERVVECGSGVSTIAIARLLRELGRGHAWALEHDPGWAEQTRSRLRTESLDAVATVVEAPLRPGPPAQPGCAWYARDALARLPRSGVDLLLVDGPPAPQHEPALERSRYPALPLLADRLVPGAAIVCDDAARPGERWMLERWNEELEIGLREAPGETAVGFARLDPAAGRAAAVRPARNETDVTRPAPND